MKAGEDSREKMAYEKGLIRYTTQNAIDVKPTRGLRPRIAVYAVLLTALVGAWAWGIGHRSPLIADVLRDRNALYRVAGDGVDNSYTLKLANKTERDARYRVRVESATPGLALREGTREVTVPAGEEIGRASWRERVGKYVSISVVAGSLQKKKTHRIHN